MSQRRNKLQKVVNSQTAPKAARPHRGVHRIEQDAAYKTAEQKF